MEFNLADLFEAVVDAVGSHEALVVGGTGGAGCRLDYASLESRANRLAHMLASRGIGPGDHVGLHLSNGVEYIEGMLASYKLRAVAVNVNYRYVAEELVYLARDAELRVVITEPEFIPVVEGVHGKIPTLDHVLVTGAMYEAELAASPDNRVDVGPRSADDLYLLYTGGTTGMPKGVMWRHEDVYFASLGGRGTPSRGIAALSAPEQITERVLAGDPIMRRLPLCPLMHGGAMWVALQTLLNGGCLIVSNDRHFDPAGALRLLSDERAELTMLIGDATARPLLDALSPDPAAYDLSALQVIASGGAILSDAVKQGFGSLLGHVKIIDTFGASETGAQGRLVASSGGAPRLMTDAHTTVLDENGRPVVPGSGAIGRLARTGWIPTGYYGDPEKTATTFPVIDGVRWSVPGDLARVEQDGAIVLLGRGSMCINTGGEKVFPEEVENALKHHPAVFDALVVGIADERFGQRVAAVVALRADVASPGDHDLDTHARAHLAGYKVPRTWVRVSHCQRSPTGKPDYAWAAETAAAAG